MLTCDQGNTQHDVKAESSVRVCVSRRSARVSCSYAIQRDRQYNDDERPMTQRQLRDQLAIVKKYGIPRMMSVTQGVQGLAYWHMFSGICMFLFVWIMCGAVAICRISSEVGAPALASAVLDFSTISGHAGSGCPSASCARKSM